MKKFNNLILNFLLIFTAILLLLFLIELALRLTPQKILVSIFGDFSNRNIYQNNRKLGYSLKPNLKTSFQGHLLLTNSRGLRDREYNINKKPYLRVLALGDSFTFGEGVEIEDTFVKVLERNLKKRYPGKQIEVINAGVPGYGNDQELQFLKDEGKNYKPDLVLLGLYIGNDFLDNEIGGVNRRRVKGNGFLYDLYIERKIDEDLKGKYLDIFLCHADRYLKEKSLAYFLFKSRIDNLMQKWNIKKFYDQYMILDMESFPYFKNPLPERSKKGFELTINIIKEIKQESEQLGASLAVILIPAGFQVYETALDSLMAEYHLDKKNYDIEGLNSLLTKRLKLDGIMVLDLLPVLKKKAETDNGLYAWGHWKPEAHRIAAEEIYKFIENSRLIF